MEFLGLDNKNDFVNVKFMGSGNCESFPYLWLRDNCQCPKCFHPVSRCKLSLLRNLNLSTKPTDVKVNNKNELHVQWSDGHLSIFSTEWLQWNAFNQANREREEAILSAPKRLWNASSLGETPTVDFKEIMEQDAKLLEWLKRIERDGVCLIRNAPACSGVVQMLCERIAYQRRTYYGTTMKIESKVDPSSVGYTTETLAFHTDQPYLHYNPEVQMLHCVRKASTGGENMFADGFQVAKDMEKEVPELFKILCETHVTFIDRGTEDGKEYLTKNKRPTFERDAAGNVIKVNHSFHRDSAITMDAASVKQFYTALLHFENMLLNDKYCVTYGLEPGEVLVMDNIRLLHYRSSFTIATGHSRLLEGAYVGWDEWRSKRRVLDEKLNGKLTSM